MKVNLDALIGAVTQLTTVNNSVVVLIKTLAQNQKDLAAKLAAAIAADDSAGILETQKAIDDSATTILSQAGALAQAVTANTPAVLVQSVPIMDPAPAGVFDQTAPYSQPATLDQPAAYSTPVSDPSAPGYGDLSSANPAYTGSNLTAPGYDPNTGFNPTAPGYAPNPAALAASPAYVPPVSSAYNPPIK